MTNKYCIELLQTGSEALADLLFTGVNAAAQQTKGMQPMQGFSLAVKDATDQIVGGANGVIYYGCLYVDMLWIDKAARDLGIGSRLMQKAEELARQNKATFATVNTMDWEALKFYQKLGYEVEFTREGYDKDSKMFMLRKAL